MSEGTITWDRGLLTIVWLVIGTIIVASIESSASLTAYLAAIGLVVGVPFYYWVVQPLNLIADSVGGDGELTDG